MPVFNPIMDNKVLGREIKRGIELGREEGLQQGELKLLRRMMESRFGPIPDWAEILMNGCSAAEIEDLGVRLLRAESLEELLG